MLPVSAEFPLVQFRQYDSYHPPCVPQIQVHHLCQHLLAPIAAKIANTVGSLAAQNPARMFCYNLLSSNNWNNSEFAEVFKFTTDLMCLLFSKQPTRAIEQYLDNSVENVLRLKSSQYVVNFPELQQMCGSEIQRSSLDNLQVLPQLLSEIQYMYQQNISAPQRLQGPMQSMQGNMGQIGISDQFQNRSGAIPSFYGNQQNTGVQFGSSQQTVSLASLQTDRFATRSSGQNVVQSVQETPQTEVSKPLNLVIDPTMSSESKPNIKFSGMSFSTENVVKMSDLLVDIQDSIKPEYITDPSVSEMTSLENGISDEISVKKTPHRCLKEEFVLEDTLEDMVLVGKIYYLENEIKTKKRSFYRVFGSIANGYISTDNFDYIVPKWKNHLTFRDLVKTIKSDIAELTAWQSQLSNNMTTDAVKKYFDETNAPRDMQQFSGLIEAMSRVLTKAINNFLRFVLNTGIQIDSFIEDGENLETYLQTKLTEPQFMVFQSWQKHFLAEFHNYETRVYEKVLFVLPEKVKFYCMPTMISMAYVPVNHTEELGVHLKVGETAVINQKDQPFLWAFCESISYQREEFNAMYSDDYIVTLNDERLQMFETIANGGQYIVMKLK